MKTIARAALAAAAMLLASGLGAGAANAAPASAATAPTTLTLSATGTSVTKGPDMAADVCAAGKAAGQYTSCETLVKTTLGAPVPQSSSGTAASTNAVSASAAATGWYCRDWTQTRYPKDGSQLWSATHRGQHCWNGSTTKVGWHECLGNSGGGFTVTHLGGCPNRLNGSYIQYEDTFNVALVFKGNPLNTTYLQWARGSNNGTMTWYQQ